tara:strand:- start:15010 stop:15975 length:966 start_codon:yes stop_codon:yes gene_type:complete
MIQLFKKIVLYGLLILLALELLVRIFHLHNERPLRYADTKNVEKWVPNQTNFAITGNRKQNIGRYYINNFGFNSVHENYIPNENSKEIALVGDSFIEGFHEDYTNSLGQQIEKNIKGLKVLEFGYAGYDLADELHLVKAYGELFNNIDHTFIYLRYEDDIDRNSYELSSRLSLDTPLNRLIKKIKLLVYLKDIGAFNSIKQIPSRFKSIISRRIEPQKEKLSTELHNKAMLADSIKLENFKMLLNTYPIDKNKYTFLLDKSKCSTSFLAYLDSNGYSTLDLNKALGNSEHPTTLIYDQHWSKHGRSLVAKLLIDYIKTEVN